MLSHYVDVFVCAGAQLHQLTQVGLSSQIGAYPVVGRSVSGPSGSSWTQYHSDEEVSRPANNREIVSQPPQTTEISILSAS